MTINTFPIPTRTVDIDLLTSAEANAQTALTKAGEASASATLSQAYATGTAPGGPGTLSAREEADRAAGFAVATAADVVLADAARVAAQLYDPTFRFTDVQALKLSQRAAGGEGTIWQAGSFLYREAASSATDQHLTTAGGVKLYIVKGEDVFETLAAMLSSGNIAVGMNVRVLGQTLRGIGAAEYRIVAAGTGVADGDNYHNLTGIAGQAERQSSYQSIPIYVDAIRGDDANNGFTANRAKATIAGLLSALASNLTGADIRLSRGSVWRERLVGSAGSNWCKVAAYGSGRKPVLDARDVIASGDIVKTAGFTSVYEATWTPVGTGQISPSLWENGVRLRRVADLATCDSTPGTYFADSTPYANGSFVVGTPRAIYIHATGSGNPATNGSVYQQAMRRDGLTVGDYAAVYDVRCIGGQNDNGVSSLGRFSFAAGCIWEDGTKHNNFQSSGMQVDCIAWKMDRWYRVWSGSTGIAFIAYNTANQADPQNWLRCLYISGNDGVSFGDGFYAHAQAGQTSFGTVAITDCESYNADAFSVGVAQTSNLLIDGAITYNTGRLMIGGGAAVSNTVRRSLWYLDRDPSEITYRGFWRSQFAGAQNNIVIEDSIAYMDNGCINNNLSVFRLAENGHSGNVRVSRFVAIATAPSNAIFNNNTTAITWSGSTGSLNVTMENVLVEGWDNGTSPATMATMLNVGAGCTYIGRGNVFNGFSDIAAADRGRVIYQGTTYATGALYLAALQPGNEIGSVTTNTNQFAGDTASQDYRLLSGGDARANDCRPRFTPRYFGQALADRLDDLTEHLEAA